MTPFMYAAAGPRDEKLIGKPGCGGCHPGGGGLEYDRDGKRYDRRLKADPNLARSLDGDYYKSQWDKTGVVEADCFLCHIEGYNFKARNRHLKLLNFRWASTAASGIGQVTGFVREGAVPVVEYNRRFFNEDGKIVLPMTNRPPSENCVFCHGLSDRKKRGFSWNDTINHDVHNFRGMSCIQCHPGELDHNFAKGDENVSTVRDDLDNTMMRCEQCHEQGYMGAPRAAHTKIRPNHLKKMACETCHIPALHRAGGEGFDVTVGSVINYAKVGAKKIGDEFTWYPRYQRDEEKKIWPVNPLLPAFYTNLNGDGIYYPLFARENKKAYLKIKDRLSGKQPNKPELHTEEEIKMMLTALTDTLQGNKRFTRIEPFYHKGGFVHHLNKDGQVVMEKDHTWVGHLEGFNINHNIAPAGLALGANGCEDCHSDTSHFFKGQIVTDLFGPDGTPVTTRSGRLIGCNPVAFQLNQFHQLYLTPYVSIGLLLLVFFLVLHYTGQGPKGADFTYEPAEIIRFDLADRWTHLMRMVSFLMLLFTGYIFFYNKIGLLDVVFGSYETAVVWHWVFGLIFVVFTVISVGLWAKDAKFVDYDKEWLRKRGGYLGGKEVEVPAGRLNAGQKIFFWLTTLLSLIMGVTGILLIFKDRLPLTINCLNSTIHGVIAILFVATVIAHAYLGTIANPGTWRALVDGKVSRKWARKHHSEWFKRITKKEKS